jgi:hypothetical protein
VRRIQKKDSQSKISRSSKVKEVRSNQIENSVAIDIQLSIGCHFRDAENQGPFD